jgi:hypothetical protein
VPRGTGSTVAALTGPGATCSALLGKGGQDRKANCLGLLDGRGQRLGRRRADRPGKQAGQMPRFTCRGSASPGSQGGNTPQLARKGAKRREKRNRRASASVRRLHLVEPALQGSRGGRGGGTCRSTGLAWRSGKRKRRCTDRRSHERTRPGMSNGVARPGMSSGRVPHARPNVGRHRYMEPVICLLSESTSGGLSPE